MIVTKSAKMHRPRQLAQSYAKDTSKRSNSSLSTPKPHTPGHAIIDEDPPPFEVRELSGLNETELDELDELFDMINSRGVMDMTPDQEDRLAELLSRAHVGTSSVKVVFGAEIITSWKRLKISGASKDSTFSDHKGFDGWWKALSQEGRKLEKLLDNLEPEDDSADINGSDQNEQEKPASDEMHQTTGGKTVTPKQQKFADQMDRDTDVSDNGDDHVQQEEQVSDEMHRTTGGKTIPPEMQHFIDLKYSDENLSDIPDDDVQQGKLTSRDILEASLEASHNEHKRTYGVAFDTDRRSSTGRKRPSQKTRETMKEGIWDQLLGNIIYKFTT
jgi:hypothetical protein